MKEEFAQALSETSFSTPRCTILRNYDFQPYTTPGHIREGLLLQLTNPVRFQQSVEKVPQTAQIVEVGHKRWISKFADEVRR
jgi:malonyl CoA-acyl carrier protein transacylase